jgi:hypothetical protein
MERLLVLQDGRASETFETLDVGNDPDLQKVKADTLIRLAKQIEEAKVNEAEEGRQRSATFE